MHLVFYVDNIKKGFAGSAKGPIIRILKTYKDNKGLLEHEKIHVKQWWTKGLIVHIFRYKFSKKYRYECEIEAYIEQMKHSCYPELYAKFVTDKYNLDVTFDQAYDDITK